LFDERGKPKEEGVTDQFGEEETKRKFNDTLGKKKEI